jgi:hypothetical protein
MAGLFSLLLVPALLTSGNRPLPRYGLTPLEIVAVYFLAGALGGGLIAVLYPIRRWFLGAFALGVFGALPAYLGAGLLMRSGEPWSEAWIIGGICAFLVGGGLGTQISSESHSRPVPSPRLIKTLWIIVGAGQIVGWYLGLNWPGEPLAAIGLGLVFLPLYIAILATLSRRGITLSSR